MPHQNRESNAGLLAKPVNSKIEKKLIAYAAAASAAGVTLLAAQPADASIVYTAINQTVSTKLPIDLNNDGIADVTIWSINIAYSQVQFASGGANNRILAAAAGNLSSASALPWGAKIGKMGAFNYSYGRMGRANFHSGCVDSNGTWHGKKNHYLGVQFSAAGQTHYGWIRMTVGNLCSDGTIQVTGYAYETIVNKPIFAGYTHEPIVEDAIELPAPARQPASLGLLALGKDGLNIWRREEDAATQNF
jgi:hypothetical protein